jgi:hypothetical protein
MRTNQVDPRGKAILFYLQYFPCSIRPKDKLDKVVSTQLLPRKMGLGKRRNKGNTTRKPTHFGGAIMRALEDMQSVALIRMSKTDPVQIGAVKQGKAIVRQGKAKSQQAKLTDALKKPEKKKTA